MHKKQGSFLKPHSSAQVKKTAGDKIFFLTESALVKSKSK